MSNNIKILVNDLDRKLDILKNDIQIMKDPNTEKAFKQEKIIRIKKDVAVIQKEIITLEKEIDKLKN